MKLGYIGLGKMGLNMIARLHEHQHEVIAYNRSTPSLEEARRIGVETADSLSHLISLLPAPRTVWLMVPHHAVDELLQEIRVLLKKGDTVIDGGNSFFKDSMRRGEALEKEGIHFIDVGVSGGPGGARNGACLMIGGDHAIVTKHKDLFKAIAAPHAFGHMGSVGAGHFVKMVHNGIEYGMMQALAEGFAILKKSSFNLDVEEVARVYHNQSVIDSRLVGWLLSGFKEYGAELKEVSGSIAHTGEGEWTIATGKELGVETPVIQASFDFRIRSKEDPNYTGKVVSVLRNQFGGHSVTEK